MVRDLASTLSFAGLALAVLLLVGGFTMWFTEARVGKSSASVSRRGAHARSPAPTPVDREQAEKENRRARQNRHDSIGQRHAKIVEAYSDFLFDPIAAFRYPLLNDVRCTKTATFVDALTAANQLSIEEGILSSDMLDEYQRRVERLVTAWDIADTNARRVGLDIDGMPTDVRDDIERAIRLLQHALDDTTTEAERESYLTKAAEITASAARAGYIVIASETAEAIGHETLLQLTAGSAT